MSIILKHSILSQKLFFISKVNYQDEKRWLFLAIGKDEVEHAYLASYILMSEKPGGESLVHFTDYRRLN